MKIVLTAKGTNWESQIDPRFGRAEYLLIFDEESNELSHFDNGAIANEQHGAGPYTAQKVLEQNPDVLITGNTPGNNALQVLKKAKLDIYIGAGDMKAKDAYNEFKNNKLEKI